MERISGIEELTKLEDFLSAVPSKATRKNYRNGVRKFERYLGKSIETLLPGAGQGRTVEKYFVWLKDQGYKQNSARALTNGPIQFLKYFGADVKIRRSIGVNRTEVSIKDHMLTIDDLRKMYKVADFRERMILLLAKDFGLRVGDFCKLLKVDFSSRIGQVPPVQIDIMTAKEGIVAHAFISEESIEQLKIYLPTLNKDCKYLWQSARQGHLDEETINLILRNLAEKAGLQLTGSIRFHCFRKLFLRTAAELGVNSWNAKLLVGKAVESAIATYINGVRLKEDFIKISNVLRINEPQSSLRSPTFEEVLDLVSEVQKDDLREKVKKLWNEKYGQFKTTGSPGMAGLVITEPNFDAMSPKELLTEYLKLRKRKD
jgi:integrase